jgi:methanogenic corrinoid protein MtbC1
LGDRRRRLSSRPRPEPDDAPIDVAALCRAIFPVLAERGSRVRAQSRVRLVEPAMIEEFLGLLIDEDDDAFERFLLERAADSADPQAVVEELLGPVARLVGDYWRMDVCDFMKVTVVMSRIQRLFWTVSSLYPPIRRPTPGRSVLLTPMPGEQHGFGLMVVEDALQRAGWHVDRCCSDEEDAYFDLLERNDYVVVGISLSGLALAHSLPAFIRRTRKKSRNASVSVMVGGSLFVEKPDLAFAAGADYLALDGLTAIGVAEAAAASLDGDVRQLAFG